MTIHSNPISLAGLVRDLRFEAEGILKETLQASGRYDELVKAGKAGGYYSQTSREYGVCTLLLPSGPIPGDKVEGRRDFSLEKGFRLWTHLGQGHCTSFQSRDPTNNKWGGAVAGFESLHSFSGCPEELDQVYSCLMAVRFDDMSFEEAGRLVGPEWAKYQPIVSKRMRIK
jgi:hypothetical protein